MVVRLLERPNIDAVKGLLGIINIYIDWIFFYKCIVYIMTSVCCNPPLNPTQISNNCKGTCNISSTNNPSSIYQRQKIIQNTVRVRSSLFTMNIGALNVYQKPSSLYQDVNWKQMSDRKIPHIQQTVVPSTKSTKHSYTWHRPGCQSPGGKGVDMDLNCIRANSYGVVT
jgi:hypothetical protein